MVFRSEDDHDYRACGDEDCPRFPCRVYKEGVADGYWIGHAAGFAEGYDKGFPDGQAACPRPHR